MGCGGSKEPTNAAEVKSDPLARKRSITTMDTTVRLTERTRLDFKHVTADPEALEALMAFAAAEFSDENLLFWVEVRDAFLTLGGPSRRATPRETEEPYPVEPVGAEVDAVKLQPVADGIIKKYLLEDSAELPVTMSSAHQKLFKKKPSPGVYTYSLTMFDAVHKQVLRDIDNDVFKRFRLSDAAESLLRKKPMLAIGDPSQLFAQAHVQETLAELMAAALELAHCDRMTAWLVDGKSIFSVCSSMLGNAILKLPLGAGLAGKAAKTGQDVLVADASKEADFDFLFDQATGYKTQSVLCVAIRRDDSDAVQAVIQLLNKKGAQEGEVVPFSEDDATRIRARVGPPLLNAFEDVALDLVGAPAAAPAPAPAIATI